MKTATPTALILLAACSGAPAEVSDSWPGECAPTGAAPPASEYTLGEAVCEIGCDSSEATDTLAGIDDVVLTDEQLGVYSGAYYAPLGFTEVEGCVRSLEGATIRLGENLYVDRVWACETSCGPMLGVEESGSFASAELIPGVE